MFSQASQDPFGALFVDLAVLGEQQHVVHVDDYIRKSWKMLIGAYRCLSVFFHLFSSKYAAMHRYGVSRSPITAWNFF